jgi:hypothetical protein
MRKQIVGVGLGVSLGDAQQNQQTGSDLADDFLADAHLSSKHTLNDGAH